MKKIILSIVLLAVLAAGISGQESPVLMTIADEEITLAEFERIYKKNNNENSLNRQSPEEYLELFINFKLKVKEAEALGMDTTSKFINELAGYREQLAKPYLTDDEAKEEILQEAYERSKLDINASHILIKMPARPTPEDTVAAYEKIMAIRDRIVKGESFESVARATSEDASVSRNGGNLGYFTVFSMIYSFENVAYTTPVGEVSMPFQSSYGYHILKVHDRRPARGQVKVSHIFVRTPEDMTEAEKEAAHEKAEIIYDSIQSGVDFATLAKHNSDDRNTAQKGGDIPWFGTGRMIPEFENEAFSLENPGDVTKPFKSFYGWHIVKLADKKGIGSFEDMKPELQEKVGRGDRSKAQTDRYVNKLKEEYGFRVHEEGLALVKASVDTTLLTGKWEGGGLLEQQLPLAMIGDHNIVVGTFVSYMLDHQARNQARHLESYVDQLFKEFIDKEVIQYEDAHLAEKYPEFRYIYEEYHDGILLFDIMDKQVWSKAVNDTLGLEAYHMDHKQEYMWGSRSQALLVTASDGANLDGIRKAYKKIAKGKLQQEDLNATYCSNDTVDCVTMESLLVEEGENEMVDAMKGQTGLGPVVSSEDGEQFVILVKQRNPEPKELDEARGQITSDYQNYLEEQWIKALREKYPVEVNPKLLDQINDEA